MPASIDEALKQYGFLGQLARSVPELRGLFSQAVAHGWDTAEFSRALQDSKWWKNSEQSVKQYQLQKVSNPGEVKKQRGLLVNQARTLAAEMGVKGLNQAYFAHLADIAQMHGWSEAQLRQQLAGHLSGTGQTWGGSAGEAQQQIRSIYADYGLPYNSISVLLTTRNILAGRTTVQAVRAMVQDQAMQTFPALAAQIKAGHTVAEIAQPYLATKAQLLERAPATVTLSDPAVKRALQARDGKGQPTTMPLWEFEQQVKADPAWDKTKNAHNDYSQMAMQIGHDMGFLGG